MAHKIKIRFSSTQASPVSWCCHGWHSFQNHKTLAIKNRVNILIHCKISTAITNNKILQILCFKICPFPRTAIVKGRQRLCERLKIRIPKIFYNIKFISFSAKCKSFSLIYCYYKHSMYRFSIFFYSSVQSDTAWSHKRSFITLILYEKS